MKILQKKYFQTSFFMEEPVLVPDGFGIPDKVSIGDAKGYYLELTPTGYFRKRYMILKN